MRASERANSQEEWIVARSGPVLAPFAWLIAAMPLATYWLSTLEAGQASVYRERIAIVFAVTCAWVAADALSTSARFRRGRVEFRSFPFLTWRRTESVALAGDHPTADASRVMTRRMARVRHMCDPEQFCFGLLHAIPKVGRLIPASHARSAVAATSVSPGRTLRSVLLDCAFAWTAFAGVWLWLAIFDRHFAWLNVIFLVSSCAYFCGGCAISYGPQLGSIYVIDSRGLEKRMRSRSKRIEFADVRFVSLTKAGALTLVDSKNAIHVPSHLKGEIVKIVGALPSPVFVENYREALGPEGAFRKLFTIAV